ncbi:4386_t:CDS:2, partial [Entrophospora sp. SA101]
DGLDLLRSLPANSVKLVFFDPQYEKSSQVSRIKSWPLNYQTAADIQAFFKAISRVLKLSELGGFWCVRAWFWLAKGLSTGALVDSRE